MKAHVFSFVCFDTEPMPAVPCFKICSSVSAWLGVFARMAMSSAKSTSVIVFAGYLPPLFFVSSKPFFFKFHQTNPSV